MMLLNLGSNKISRSIQAALAIHDFDIHHFDYSNTIFIESNILRYVVKKRLVRYSLILLLRMNTHEYFLNFLTTGRREYVHTYKCCLL